MKKGLLLLFVPLIFLAGCGGGGGSDVGTLTPGDNFTGGTPSTPNVQAETLTITFPPVQKVQTLAFQETVDFVRTHARLVVRQTSPDPVPIYEDIVVETCTDPFDEETCTYEVVGQRFVRNDYVDLYRNISDGELEPDGSGTVSIAVPPGVGYTLEVLTYVDLRPFVKNKLMWEYDKSAPFDIVRGQVTEVTLDLGNPLAELVLPTEVDSGTPYMVSATMSTALRTEWYLRQTLEATEMGDLTTQWFMRSTTDPGVLAGTDAIELMAPTQGGTPTVGDYVGTSQWTIWHHGQFFINDTLINEGEKYQDWTFGTGSAGPLNPDGQVVIIIQ